MTTTSGSSDHYFDFTVDVPNHKPRVLFLLKKKNNIPLSLFLFLSFHVCVFNMRFIEIKQGARTAVIYGRMQMLAAADIVMPMALSCRQFI